ncbi:unnamed protein product [Sympodiomycopsis kandeliae]
MKYVYPYRRTLFASILTKKRTKFVMMISPETLLIVITFFLLLGVLEPTVVTLKKVIPCRHSRLLDTSR